MLYCGLGVDGDWYNTSKGDEDFAIVAFNDSASTTATGSSTPSPFAVVLTMAPISQEPTPSPSGESPTPSPFVEVLTLALITQTSTPSPSDGSSPLSSSPSGSPTVQDVAIVGGSVAGALLIIAALVFCFFCWRRNNRQQQNPVAESKRSHVEDSVPPPSVNPVRGFPPEPPSYRSLSSLPSYRNFAKLPSYRSLFSGNAAR